ncbi:related to APP1 - Actin Patch Protein [Melanopsichium pennsylvanicum]|uniref:Related to APP1 - Actin Patch Protein n=2 Tax=Melanopsichium pennsylvanicum TaxID=63383 RepID=A0AAJ4XRL4_9BASI|nr:related to APP1 - Actin Patch Protein [Melanopsichium pennsylvanicum]
MRRSRIRSRATSILTSSVDYLATRDWQAVAGSARSKLQLPSTSTAPTGHNQRQSTSFSSTPTLPRIRDMSARSGPENVVLLPGWAQRRVARDRHPQGWATLDAPEDLEDGEIELHVSLHGFVAKQLDAPSTSQRIFNQMARQLAGLPKIQTQPLGSSALDSSSSAMFVDEPQQIDYDAPQQSDSEQYRTEHASEKIARKLIENADDQTLVRLMENLNAFPTDSAAAREAAREANQDAAEFRRSATFTQPKRIDTMLSGGSAQWLNRSLDEVTLFHQNLTHRLQAYWVYRSPHKDVHIEISPVINGDSARDQQGNHLILASTRLTADSTGQFEHRLVVPWHMLSSFCRHYADLLQAGPDEIEAVEIRAKLLTSKAEGSIETGSESPWRRCPISEDHSRRVRIISDIDDTVKHTGVVQGAKQILRNVFVLPYHEAEIKGISSWYHAMTDLGAGLHYVTNAPLELHSLVLDFLEAVRLPVSHLVLKHYPSGARSLLSSWLEPAGERKRSNVVKILDNFRTSQFILIGDSGELDLELYCALAAERPSQVRGVFIRDVSSPPAAKGEASSFSITSASERLSRTSSEMVNALPKAPRSALTQPASARRAEAADLAFFDTSYPPKAPTALNLPTYRYTGQATEAARSSRALSEQEIRQAQALQTRLNKAASMLPRSTVFRLFKEGGDVEELACQLIRELQNGTRPADRSA